MKNEETERQRLELELELYAGGRMGRTFRGGINETRKEIKNRIVTESCSENASFGLSGCEEQQKINA